MVKVECYNSWCSILYRFFPCLMSSSCMLMLCTRVFVNFVSWWPGCSLSFRMIFLGLRLKTSVCDERGCGTKTSGIPYRSPFLFLYRQLRARRALSIFKNVPLRTRRVLIAEQIVYSDSTVLLVLSMHIFEWS